MELRSLSAHELDAGLIAAWDAICRETEPESPYLSPWFTTALAEVRKDVFVTLIEAEGQLQGVFPYQRQGRRGRPVAWPLNDCQGVITKPGVAIEGAALLEASGLSTFAFDHLAAGQGIFAPAIRRREPSPVIDLSKGFEAWRAEVSKGSKRLKKLARARRVLGRDHGGEDVVRVEVLSDDRVALRRVIEWKLDQCRRTGTFPYFEEAWTVELVERLFEQGPDAAPGCAGALSVLYVEDEIAAVHFGIRSRKIWHWWFPSYDNRWSSYSPGSLLLLDVCEAVAGAGHSQTAIDLGTGEADYKDIFANTAYEVVGGTAAAGVAGRTEVALAESLSATRAWARATPALGPVRRLRKRLRGS